VNRGRQQGAAAVEFAIVLIPLILLVFGIIQFGLAFGRIQGMHASAREGARLAALARDVTAGDVEARVYDALPPLFSDPATDLAVTVTRPGGGDWCVFEDDGEGPLPNELVQVTVSLTGDAPSRYALSVPFLEPMLANYRAEGVFRCEASRDTP
jgi:Flp pilus assembly protein TadG